MDEDINNLNSARNDLRFADHRHALLARVRLSYIATVGTVPACVDEALGLATQEYAAGLQRLQDAERAVARARGGKLALASHDTVMVIGPEGVEMQIEQIIGGRRTYIAVSEVRSGPREGSDRWELAVADLRQVAGLEEAASIAEVYEALRQRFMAEGCFSVRGIRMIGLATPGIFAPPGMRAA